MKVRAVLVRKELRDKRGEWIGMLVGIAILGFALLYGLAGTEPGRYASGVVLGSVVLGGFFVGGFLVFDERHGPQAQFAERLPVARQERFTAKFASFLLIVSSALLLSSIVAVLGQVYMSGGFSGFLPRASFTVYLGGLIAAGIVVFASGAIFCSRFACLASVLILALPLGVQQSFVYWQNSVPGLRDFIADVLPWGGLMLLTACGFTLVCARAYARDRMPRRSMALAMIASPLAGFLVLLGSTIGWQAMPSLDAEGCRFSESRVTLDGRYLVGSVYGPGFAPWPVRVDLATGELRWAKQPPSNTLPDRLAHAFHGKRSWLAARAIPAPGERRPMRMPKRSLYFVQGSSVSDVDEIAGAFDLKVGRVMDAAEARARARTSFARPQLLRLPGGLALHHDLARREMLTLAGDPETLAEERRAPSGLQVLRPVRPGCGFGIMGVHRVFDPFAMRSFELPEESIEDLRILPHGWVVRRKDAPHYLWSDPGGENPRPLSQLQEDFGSPVVLRDGSMLFFGRERCFSLRGPGDEMRPVELRPAGLEAGDFDSQPPAMRYLDDGSLLFYLRVPGGWRMARFADGVLSCTIAMRGTMPQVAGLAGNEIITVERREIWAWPLSGGARRQIPLRIDRKGEQ